MYKKKKCIKIFDQMNYDFKKLIELTSSYFRCSQVFTLELLV